MHRVSIPASLIWPQKWDLVQVTLEVGKSMCTGICAISCGNLTFLGNIQRYNVKLFCSQKPCGVEKFTLLQDQLLVSQPTRLTTATGLPAVYFSSATTLTSHFTQPGSKVCAAFETLWEFLASNMMPPSSAMQLTSKEETCCHSMLERFAMNSRASGQWLWMARSRLLVSDVQKSVHDCFAVYSSLIYSSRPVWRVLFHMCLSYDIMQLDVTEQFWGEKVGPSSCHVLFHQ